MTRDFTHVVWLAAPPPPKKKHKQTNKQNLQLNCIGAMEMVSRSTRITEDAEVSGSQFSRREDAKARESLREAPSARDTHLSN